MYTKNLSTLKDKIPFWFSCKIKQIELCINIYYWLTRVNNQNDDKDLEEGKKKFSSNNGDD